MPYSWIEKNNNEDEFIFSKEKIYSHRDFYKLSMEYLEFANENISKNEKICFISNDILKYAIFSNIIPMARGIFVPMNPKSSAYEIQNKMKIISSNKIFYDKTIDLENIPNLKKIKIFSNKNSKNNSFWPNEDDPFCILFTSGSSGQPKPVTISRKNIESSCIASQKNLEVGIDDIWLLCMPPYHAGGLSIIFRSLILSNKFYIMNSFNPREIFDLINESKVSIISLVPTMLISILEIFEKEEMKAPSSFNFILCGGAKVSEELIIRAKMSNIKILPTYGMTETTSQIATAAPKDNNRPSGSVGKLLDKMQIKFSEKNEILVKGPNVAKYYESESIEWLETGDFGYIDASKYLFVEGRIDDLIISGGENVNPLEIENEVNKIEEINECCVFGILDEYWGNKVCMEVYLSKNISSDEIKKRLKDLDNFKIPKEIFFSNQNLPKLNNGKIDRKKISQKYYE